MNPIQGTLTEQNLLKSFSGESQARNRYTFFAEVAKKEGFEQIAAVFLETADQERAHAERFFKFLDRGSLLTIMGEFPAGIIGSTEENLIEAAAGEQLEWGTLYPTFAQIASDEGFSEVATAYKMIMRVEEFHENRYRKLLERVATDSVFRREEPILWQCRFCGFIFEGKTAPKHCPACLKNQHYFEPFVFNY